MLNQPGVYRTTGKLVMETQRKMETAFAGTSQEQREPKPESAEAAAPEPPFVPDDVLDQILANALAQQALNEMLRENDIEETIDLLDREAQRKAVAEFVVMARKQQEERAAEPEEVADEFPEISDDLVLFVVGEPRLHDQLRDIMRRKGLAGEPSELTFDKLRAVVAELMKESVDLAQIAQQGEAPSAPAGGQKHHHWWEFWR
jgi:hypothetical protein